ncbi:MAG: ABC transporter transmembrane domain-containing protein [Pseudomonadota bacterium]
MPLLRYLKPHGWRISLAALALVVAAGTVLSLGSGLKFLIDEGLGSGDPGLLDQAALVMGGVVILLAGATFLRFYLVSWLGERVVADIRRDVFSHLLTLDPGFFETAKSGEVMSRLTTDTTLLQVVVGSSASIAIRNTLLLIGGMVMLAFTSPKLTGITLLMVPIIVLPIVIYGRKVRRLSRLSQDRIADVGAYATEVIDGIRTVQAFTHEAVDRSRFNTFVRDAFEIAMTRVQARAILTAAVIILAMGAVCAILWIGGRDLQAGRISGGELGRFVFLSLVVAGAMGAVSEVLGDLQRAAGATERLMDLLATPSGIVAPANPKHLPVPSNGTVVFDNVVFHYPARKDWAALNGINLSVRAGERLAIVGPSGAGKTTIFNLILRFYDPACGEIRLDGVPLAEVDPLDIRARIGLVPQEPVIFGTSALENIRFGRPDASDEEVEAAARAASAHAFITDLPDGYETFLGERGVRLSGGQRQRLAIARAILRDPALLLLDEATSALDAESERAVQGALETLMEGRTSIVIAHRLATVRQADRIIVMEAGRIAAEGTHDALVAQDGLYAKLARLQFADGMVA